MNLLSYVFGCNCNDVFRILYFEQFAAGRPHVCGLFIVRWIDRSFAQRQPCCCKQKKKQTEEEWYWKIFCLTVSCFAHNYVCLTAKFACFKSTFLRVKSKMFTFCRDNLFDLLMIIFSVEFVVLCFEVRCFFLRVCVVLAGFTCLKSALGA